MEKENLLTKTRKRYCNLKMEIQTFNEDIVTASTENEEDIRKRYMHLMYRDGESSTSYEEEYDDYPPLETSVETDHEKLQEKIKQSKEDLEKAK